jgi:lysine-N-methylase
LSALPTPAARYADSFRCIGAECEDSCCQGWKIPIDPAALDRYHSLPASPLKSQIIAAIAPAPARGTDALSTSASTSAMPSPPSILRMNDDNRCPLLTQGNLCSIHAQLGEQFLPSVCASYPRVQRQLGPIAETALALSCPEAARLVLLGPAILSPSMPSPSILSPSILDSAPPPQPALSGEHSESTSAAPDYFAEIRSTTLALIGAQNIPLWQRLFLLCLLCHRLDSIESGQIRADIPRYLADFRAAAASGSLAPQMESTPFDPEAQLDAVLRLAGLMLHRSRVTPRFAECIAAFTSGIGNGPSATLATLTDAYTVAYRQWFAPFERLHPHVLENYLVNLVVLNRFPFGRASDSSGPPSSSPLLSGSSIAGPSKSREFARLAAQFALTRGLLIGVAGHHRERFSTEHVVHTVQTVSRHFDHHPEFLSSAHALLVECSLEGITGLSVLLRNTPEEKSPPVFAPIAAIFPGETPVDTVSTRV